jgi:hypothetical protein
MRRALAIALSKPWSTEGETGQRNGKVRLTGTFPERPPATVIGMRVRRDVTNGDRVIARPKQPRERRSFSLAPCPCPSAL